MIWRYVIRDTKEKTMRTALIVGIVALASGATADPQPTASEVFALRTECGKLGEAWVKKHPPEPWTEKVRQYTYKTIYDAKSNRCIVYLSEHEIPASEKSTDLQLLYDAQTNNVLGACKHVDGKPEDETSALSCRQVQETLDRDEEFLPKIGKGKK